MSLKLFGAILILAACSSFGFYLAAQHCKEVNCLRHFIGALDYMGCELQYHMTPLPQLMHQTAAQCYQQQLQNAFLKIAYELEDKFHCNMEQCVLNVLKTKDIMLPSKTRAALIDLGRSMGRFDIDGQLKGLENTRKQCSMILEDLSKNQSERLRSYRTLGICAGAAMVILFI